MIDKLEWWRRLNDEQRQAVNEKRNKRYAAKPKAGPDFHQRVVNSRRLAFERTHEALDATNETYWTIPMTLAWIVSRDPLLVREVWDRWQPDADNQDSSHFVGAWIEYVHTRDNPSSTMKPGAAWAELKSAIAGDKIVLMIRVNDADTRIAVNAADADALPDFCERYDTLRLKHSATVYRYGLLKVADVMSVWPGPSRSGSEIEKPKRGPKRKYNQEMFLAEARRVLEEEGGVAPANGSAFRQADLAELMATWCAKKFEKVPGDRWIRENCALAIANYGTGTNSA